LTVDKYYPQGVDPNSPAIIWWCGGGWTGCIDGSTINTCLGSTTASCVLMAEATGKPIWLVNTTQGARCWLAVSASSGVSSLSVSCIQQPAAPAGFTIDYETGTSEHLTCTSCPSGGPATWTLSSPTTQSHVGTTNPPPAGAAIVLMDAVAMPRQYQDADCFGQWFANNGGTATNPGNPQNMQFWSFSSGSNVAWMLMPSSTGLFSKSCDSTGSYGIGVSFTTATPVDIPGSYQNGNGDTQTGVGEAFGCLATLGSNCATALRQWSPLDHNAVGNPNVSLMSGAVGDDTTVPPAFNEVPLQSSYGALGVTISWISLPGTPDYHEMDCDNVPIWPTNCMQRAIKALRNTSPNGPLSH
jgi:hypothetical protein